MKNDDIEEQVDDLNRIVIAAGRYLGSDAKVIAHALTYIHKILGEIAKRLPEKD